MFDTFNEKGEMHGDVKYRNLLPCCEMETADAEMQLTNGQNINTEHLEYYVNIQTEMVKRNTEGQLLAFEVPIKGRQFCNEV